METHCISLQWGGAPVAHSDDQLNNVLVNRREKSPLSLGCTPARARDSEHGGLEASFPELPGDPVSHAPRLALWAALLCNPY